MFSRGAKYLRDSCIPSDPVNVDVNFLRALRKNPELRLTFHRMRALARRLPPRASGLEAGNEPTAIRLAGVADPARAFRVMWERAPRSELPQVRYRAAGGGQEWQLVGGRARSVPGSRHQLCEVTVGGLVPDTAYEYELAEAAAGTRAGVYRTRTLPSGDQGKLRFVFFCDTGIAGRADGLTGAVENVISAMADADPHCALGGGDYAYFNKDPRFARPAEAIAAWFGQMEPLLARAPLYAQFGNHEVYLKESYDEWRPHFPRLPGYRNGRSFAVDLGPAHVVGLFVPQTLMGEGELAWLDQDLAAARARGARWLVVFQHAPVYGHGKSHPARAADRERLLPILRRHGVDLHLSGHDQSFERTHPIDDRYQPVRTEGAVFAKGAGTLFAKVSPSGKRSDKAGDFSRLPPTLPPEIAVSDDSAHHFAVCEIDGGQSLTVETYALAEGSETAVCIDRFVVAAGSAWKQQGAAEGHAAD